jgi:hypothetical protein
MESKSKRPMHTESRVAGGINILKWLEEEKEREKEKERESESE